jgi:PAS domain S-box-containing protein
LEYTPGESNLALESDTIGTKDSNYTVFPRRSATYLAALTLFGLLISVVVTVWISWEKAGTLAGWEARLSIMADDRLASVNHLLDSVFNDIRLVSSWPTVRSLAERPNDPDLQDHLLVLLQGLLDSHRYEAIVLFDLNGRRIVGIPADTHDLHSFLPQDSDEPLADLLDFDQGARLLVESFVNVAGRRVGSVMVSVDPGLTLYPIFASEAVPTRTSESLLVREVDGAYEFLTPLRHSEENKFPVPLLPDNLAAQAATGGHEGFGSYRDYRNQRVFAATRVMDNAPWGLVVKVDRSEAMEGFYREVIGSLGMGLSLFLAALGLGYGTWSRQETQRNLELQRARENEALAEEALETQAARLYLANRRYRIALGSSPITLFEQDRELRYTWVDHPLPGLRSEEMVGKTDLSLFGERGRKISSLAGEALEKDCRQQSQVELLVGDTLRVYDVSITPIRDSSEQAIGVMGVAVEITRRVRAEEERRRLAAAIEQSPVSVEITDVEGRLVYVNPAFSQISGYGSEESLGRDISFLKSEVSSDEMIQDLWSTISEGRTWHGEFCNCAKGGPLFWVSATISPVFGESGEITHYVAVKEDITEQKQALAKLEQTRNQLEQSQKLEAIGRLAGGVAHDFNNLLTILIGNLELMKPDCSSEQLTLIDEMWNACNHAQGLTRQLLAFSRKQVLAPRTVELNATVESIFKLLARLVGEDVRMTVSKAPHDVFARVDPVQLEQVLMNLAINARDALPDEEPIIEVGVGSEHLETGRAWPGGVLPAGQYASICVSDNGCGISPSNLAHIFDPFFTTKPAGKGTGLGLSTVFGIVEQSGGGVFVESEIGQGTTFRVLIPLGSNLEASAKEALTREDSQRCLKKFSVVVVEDEPPLRRLIERVLKNGGHRVSVFESGEKALEAVAEIAPDLLITDVVLTGMSGPTLADKLAAIGVKTTVLFISGYSDVEFDLTSKGRFFLAKPFSPSGLLAKIDNSMRESQL